MPAATEVTNKQPWGLCVAPLLLVAMTLLVFGQVVHFEFLKWDDPVYVVDNPHVRGGLTWQNIRWAFTTPFFANWTPLTSLSLMLDAQLFGANAGGFHLTNLLLHTANVLLLFAVLWQMTRTVWQSAVVAALFAIHPLHVESVAWISERKDVLCTFFGFLALWAYARYASRNSRAAYAAALVAFACSLMSKQMLVTLPCLLLLLDYWPLRRAGRPLGRLILEKLPFFALAAVFSVITLWVQDRAGATTMLHISWKARCLNAILVYGLYLQKAFYPVNLATFYPHPGEDVSAAAAGAALIVLIALTVAAIALKDKRPYLLVGWLWYLGTLFPVIGLVQFGMHQMADRYTYVPLVGVFIALTWLVGTLPQSFAWGRWLRDGLTVSALTALMILAWRQTGVWHDSRTLFEHAAAVTKDNAMAYQTLGNALVAAQQHDEAVKQFQRALEIAPESAEAHMGLGFSLMALGRQEEGLAHFQEAAKLDPAQSGEAESRAQLALGDSMLAQRRYTEAIVHYRKAIAAKPEFSEAHNNLGVAYAIEGRLSEASASFQEAVHVDPYNVEARNNLGRLALQMGRHSEAMQHYQHALRLDSDNAAAHFGLGKVLAEMRRYPEAAEEFRKTLELDPGFTAAQTRLDEIGRDQSR